MLYNGLYYNLNTLSKFVYIYETRIKTMSRTDDFLNLSKGAACVFKSKIQPKIKYATKDEIANQTDFTKQSLFFTKKKVLIIDFCRHLRNSFNHALLIKQRTRPISFSITDISSNQYTCKGFLNYTSVNKFILHIIQDYELYSLRQ